MKKLLAIVLCLVMVLGMAACGGTEGTVDEETGKTWIIATDTVFKPFEYTDADGNFVGIDVDILAAIAEDQGFKYELNSLGWDASIAACQAGQADGMIAGASITDARIEAGWIFSDGYYQATQCIAVASDSEIASVADLSGQTVAVKIGTQGASYAESIKDEIGFEITYLEDSPTMYQAVLGGQAAACFEDTPIMELLLRMASLQCLSSLILRTKVSLTALQHSPRTARNFLLCSTQVLLTSRQKELTTRFWQNTFPSSVLLKLGFTGALAI